MVHLLSFFKLLQIYRKLFNVFIEKEIMHKQSHMVQLYCVPLSGESFVRSCICPQTGHVISARFPSVCLVADRISFQISFVSINLCCFVSSSVSQGDTWAVVAGSISVVFLLCWLELLRWSQLLRGAFFPPSQLTVSCDCGRATCLSPPGKLAALLQIPHLCSWTSHPKLVSHCFLENTQSK